MSGISLETPLAEALSSVVHAKITEEGWSSEEDTSLAEYIVLMLVNGKTQDQISSELASELLQDVDGIPQFAQWLSDQVTTLKNGGGSTTASTTQPLADTTSQFTPTTGAEDDGEEIPAAYDTDMGDNAPDNAPKGPKGMHGSRPAGRGGRMGGQMNKAMERSNDSVLHRVRGQSGNERINSHTRGAPKGPRGTQNRPGLQKALNGMAMGGTGQGMQNPMMQNGGQPGQPMIPISPQQQMEFMAMMEQQARMMAQFTGMVPQAMNPSFSQNMPPQNGQGRSLFDRVEAGPGRGRGGRGRGRGAHQNGGIRTTAIRQGDNGGDSQMETDSNAPPSMEIEQPSQPGQPNDPTNTMCRFNTRCINKDCPYVHQSPAAPPGIVVDMSDTCSFGAACKNSKCVGRHPSPAQKIVHQSEEMCKFYPYCSNPSCHFKHPTMPMCKNGGDCKVEHCKFTHLQTMCKFKPCKNPRCAFKHEEGQRASFADAVWTPESAQKKEEEEKKHLSERKFVEDGDEEELIKPEEGQEMDNQEHPQTEGVIT